MTLDHRLLAWVAGHRTHWADVAAERLMAAGTRPVPLLAVALVVLALVAALRAWRPAAAAAAAAVAGVVVTEVAKNLVHRPRPPAALALVRVDGWSMPSTDAALTAAAATALALGALAGGRRAGRVLAAALVVLTAVVGVALVYLGAHWATDVLAGWLVGGLLGAAAARLLGGPASDDGGRPG